MTKEEKFIAAIIEEIDSFNTGQLVQLNNIYCDESGYPDTIAEHVAENFSDYDYLFDLDPDDFDDQDDDTHLKP